MTPWDLLIWLLAGAVGVFFVGLSITIVAGMFLQLRKFK